MPEAESSHSFASHRGVMRDKNLELQTEALDRGPVLSSLLDCRIGAAKVRNERDIKPVNPAKSP
jgi:hypothetical protein